MKYLNNVYLHSDNSSFSCFIWLAKSMSMAPLLFGNGSPMLRILSLILWCMFLSKSDIGGWASYIKKNRQSQFNQRISDRGAVRCKQQFTCFLIFKMCTLGCALSIQFVNNAFEHTVARSQSFSLILVSSFFYYIFSYGHGF